jgi:hypothetical protein
MQLGDVRVSFRVAGREGARFSAIGRQKSGIIRAFSVCVAIWGTMGKKCIGSIGGFVLQTLAGDKLLMLVSGKQSAEEMFAEARANNTALTWLLRVVGWALMFAAMSLIASPLTTFGSWPYEENPQTACLFVCL